MNSKKCILLSHVWITENQGYKKDVVDLCVRHFRESNPNAYIILTGHGHRPYDRTAINCDFFYWPEFDIKEVGKGHPKSVYKGLLHAKEMGFDRVLKSRADCIVATANAHDMYDDMLQEKRFLAKQEKTGINDLLMYGDLELFLSGWDIEKWNPSVDGVINFTNTLDLQYKGDLVMTTPQALKWVYLDPYWENIVAENLEKSILDNSFDYQRFLWGRAFSLRAQSPDGIGKLRK